MNSFACQIDMSTMLELNLNDNKIKKKNLEIKFYLSIFNWTARTRILSNTLAV